MTMTCFEERWETLASTVTPSDRYTIAHHSLPAITNMLTRGASDKTKLVVMLSPHVIPPYPHPARTVPWDIVNNPPRPTVTRNTITVSLSERGTTTATWEPQSAHSGASLNGALVPESPGLVQLGVPAFLAAINCPAREYSPSSKPAFVTAGPEVRRARFELHHDAEPEAVNCCFKTVPAEKCQSRTGTSRTTLPSRTALHLL